MQTADNICIGDLEVRGREHAVVVRGTDVALSSREFEILKMLAEHPGWVFSASQLSEESGESEYSPESVSVLVSRLRHKLDAAGATGVVETVRGSGYRLHSAKPTNGGSSGVVEVVRELRDASWQLQEAVLEVEHSGSIDQKREAAQVLERARREIFTRLAE